MVQKRILQWILLVLVATGLVSCIFGRATSKETFVAEEEEIITDEIAYEMEEPIVGEPIIDPPPIVSALPPMIIYKTRADYQMRVPVTMNESRTAIESFPAPTDVYYQGELAIPTKLEMDYYLDNRGIGLYTAFLTLTYDQYAKLAAIPTAAELYDLIMDKDPLVELYQCGNRLGEGHDEFIANALITTGSIRDCNRLK